ncbi:uncharacterized protein BJ212DRAFT_1260535, partial [Suillus subaureus]
QILSVTYDNTSNNDVMVDGLKDLLPDFGRAASHTQCFFHTVNLIAKSLLGEFNITKKAKAGRETDNDVASDTSDMELADLSNEVQSEDASANVGDEELPDNEDGWVDEVALLDQDEQIELQRNIQPVKLVLLKVRQKKCKHTLILTAPSSCASFLTN